MKNVLLVFMTLIVVNFFGQKPKANNYSLTKEKINSASSINDIISDFPKDCEVLAYELTGKSSGKAFVMSGSKSKDEAFWDVFKSNLKNADYPSTLYLDLKYSIGKKIYAGNYTLKLVK